MTSPVLLDAEPETRIELPQPLKTDEALYEVVNSQRVKMPEMSFYAARIATRLGFRLNDFAEAHGLGEVVIEGLFQIPVPKDPSRNRRPDIAFVSVGRLQSNKETDLAARAAEIVPDLAIEVTSPTDRAEDQREKILEYFQAGVLAVWVVYPRLRIVDVYESPNRIEVLTTADALRGGTVLPGFELPLARIFEATGPRKP
jgi:Uma2 family endonuclease